MVDSCINCKASPTKFDPVHHVMSEAGHTLVECLIERVKSDGEVHGNEARVFDRLMRFWSEHDKEQFNEIQECLNTPWKDTRAV